MNATMIVLVSLLVLGGLALYGRRVQRRAARDRRLDVDPSEAALPDSSGEPAAASADEAEAATDIAGEGAPA